MKSHSVSYTSITRSSEGCFRRIRREPGRLRASDFFMRVMEAEFGFQMARDLPPIGHSRTREEVAEAVEGVMAGIEVVDSRYDSWTTVGTTSLIADNACHGAWIRGALVRDWREIDWRRRRSL